MRIDDGGLCWAAATQRGDGAAPAQDRALQAASQQLREPLRPDGTGAPGNGQAANLRAASALSAVQGQAIKQTSAEPTGVRAGGAERGRARGW